MSTNSDEVERRRKLTFEEAEGLVHLPAQFKDGELTQAFRNMIWTIVYSTLNNAEGFKTSGTHNYIFKSPWDTILARELLYRRHVPIDDIEVEFYKPTARDEFTQKYKKYILTAPSKLVIGFLQWIVRDPACPPNFVQSVRTLFERVPQGYSLLATDPPTFIPSVSEEERAAVEASLAAISTSELAGAKAHLAKASEALSAGDSRGAIRESIHAVESAASQLSGKKTTLAGALKILGKERALHPALQQAFEKLYGYTSDEEGVRHALIEGENNSVGEAEALFMFGACVSFIEYLNRKYQQIA